MIKITEAIEQEVQNAMTSISNAGINVYSEPQVIPLEGFAGQIHSSAIDKIEGNIFTLFDISADVRGYYCEVSGSMTISFLKGFLGALNRKLRLPMLFTGDRVYLIIKERKGRGEFELNYVSSSLSDFGRLSLSNDYYDIVEKIRNELDYEVI